MVSDAEKYKAQDEEVRKKAEAKNVLEGYCFGVRNSMIQEQFAQALSQEARTLSTAKSTKHSAGLIFSSALRNDFS